VWVGGTPNLLLHIGFGAYQQRSGAPVLLRAPVALPDVARGSGTTLSACVFTGASRRSLLLQRGGDVILG
jgi:hypothetical protein